MSPITSLRFPLKIKVCGLTRSEDVLRVAELGADLFGFVLASSPRQVALEDLPDLTQWVPSDALSVAVLVNPSQAESDRALEWVDRLQFHGSETPEFCGRYGRRAIKALRIRDAADLERARAYEDSVGAILLDSFVSGLAGGTGKVFAWDLLAGQRFRRPVFLAGGLNSENVTEALKVESVQGLDVSSGLESSPGHKDPLKLDSFFRAARQQ